MSIVIISTVSIYTAITTHEGYTVRVTYLWCIHGNLQRPSVWERLRTDLESPSLRFVLEDLTATLPVQPEAAFSAWAQRLCQRAAALPADQHVLLGYSLGGRLALQALTDCPALWTGAIIVAADPGLKGEEQKAKQLSHDQHWAQRWLHDDWVTLWQDWDAQGVFAGRTSAAERPESAFSREAIARLFDVFSKGRQADLRPRLSGLNAPPTLYVSGAEDAKYRALGDELASLCPALTHQTVPDAAHRVPWENPLAFTEQVREFLLQIGVAGRAS